MSESVDEPKLKLYADSEDEAKADYQVQNEYLYFLLDVAHKLLDKYPRIVGRSADTLIDYIDNFLHEDILSEGQFEAFKRLKVAGIARLISKRLRYKESLEPDLLYSNARYLFSQLKFSENTFKVFLVLNAIRSGDDIGDFIGSAAGKSSGGVLDIVSSGLDIPKKDAEKCLKELVGAGLISRNDSNGTANYQMNYMVEAVLRRHPKPDESLIEKFLGSQQETALDIDKDYGFLGDKRKKILAGVSGAITAVKRGLRGKKAAMASLLYGPPGTGKTELAVAIGKKLNVPVYFLGQSLGDDTIEDADDYDDSIRMIDGYDRIMELRLATKLAHSLGMKAIFVYDEAEDFLADANDHKNKHAVNKAYQISVLDNLRQPVIFISNRPDKFDPATLRRVMPAFPLSNIPRSVTLKIIQDKVKKYLDIDLSKKDAFELNRHGLSAGHIDTVLKALRQSTYEENIVRFDAKKDDVFEAIKRAVQAKNLGVYIEPEPYVTLPEKYFSPDLLNIEHYKYNGFVKNLKKSAKIKGAVIQLSGPEGSLKRNAAMAMAAEFSDETPEFVPMGQFISSGMGSMSFDSTAFALFMERAKFDGVPIIINDCEGLAAEELYGIKEAFSEALNTYKHNAPIFLVSHCEQSESRPIFKRGVLFDLHFNKLDDRALDKALNTVFGDIKLPKTRNFLASEDYTIGFLEKIKTQAEAEGNCSDANIVRLMDVELDLNSTHHQRFSRRVGFGIPRPS